MSNQHLVRLAGQARPNAASQTQGRRPLWLNATTLPLLVALCCALLLTLAQTRELTRTRAQQRLELGSRETALLLDGFHAIEQDSRSTYRWTNGESLLSFGPVSPGGQQVLTLSFGPPPADGASFFELDLAGQPPLRLPTNPGPRRYQVLLPGSAVQPTGLNIGLRSPTVANDSDPRPLGLRFEGAELTTIGVRWLWPAALQMLAQTALLVLGALLLMRLRLPNWATSAALVLVALAIFGVGQGLPLLLSSYVVRLALAFAFLTLLTYWLLPIAERTCAWFGPPAAIRALWGLMLLACTVRLTGSLYPLFFGFDLGLNTDRQIQNLTGHLVIMRRSIEFHNGLTIYPPGPYLTFMPSLLLGLSIDMVVQANMALFDGIAALAIGALARRLGSSIQAALLATLIYAAVPVGLTGLWFGLTAQVFSQTLIAPLGLALLAAWRDPQQWWRWIVMGVVLGLIVLSHIGVMITAFVWMGLAWLILTLRWLWQARQRQADPLDRMRVVRFATTLVVCGVLGIVLLYANIVGLKIQQLGTIGEELASEGYRPIYSLIWRGFSNAFHPLTLWLMPLGLFILIRQARSLGSLPVVLAALGTALVFLLIEINTGLQVRYIYFLIPIACTLAGLLLDWLAQRNVWAKWLAWGVGVVLLVQGSAYWLNAAFNDQMMSMVSLLR
jgi:hypothetical protein